MTDVAKAKQTVLDTLVVLDVQEDWQAVSTALDALIAAARAEERERAKVEATQGRAPRPTRVRFGDAAERWSAAKGPHLKPSTRRTYGDAMDAWCDMRIDGAPLGDCFLDTLGPDDVRAAMTAWSSTLGAHTVNGRLRVLRTFAKETGAHGLVAGVRTLPVPPDLATDAEDRRGLRLAELRAFLAAAPRSPWWPMLACSALTGMRFGEVSALRWGDVDLERATIRVRRSVHRHHEATPKTRAGVRTVPMLPELVRALRKHRARAGTIDAEALVFSGKRGHRSNTGLRKAMLAVCVEAGIDLAGRPTLHCLRHAWSNAMRQVAPEHVRQRVLGHAGAESGEAYHAAEDAETRRAQARTLRLVRMGGR